MEYPKKSGKRFFVSTLLLVILFSVCFSPSPVFDVTSASADTVSAANSVSPSAVGSCGFLKSHLKYGAQNEPVEVAKLQYFLKEYEGFAGLSITGVFNAETLGAVKTFQTRYANEILKPWGYGASTGVVYVLTKNKINEIICGAEISLTAAQEKEIAAFKQSRLAFSHNALKIKSNLEGGYPKETSTSANAASTENTAANANSAKGIPASASTLASGIKLSEDGMIIDEEGDGDEMGAGRSSVLKETEEAAAMNQLLGGNVDIVNKQIFDGWNSFIATAGSIIFQRQYMIVPIIIVLLIIFAVIFIRLTSKRASATGAKVVHESIPKIITKEAVHTPMITPTVAPELSITKPNTTTLVQVNQNDGEMM